MSVALTLILGLVGATGVTSTPPASAAVSVTQVSNWKLDSGAGTTGVDSVGTKPVTLGAGASWTPGLRGASSLAFNGTSTGSAVTSGPVLNTTNSFSVTAYVKFNNVTGFQTVLSQDGTSGSSFYLGLKGGGANAGKIGFTKFAADSPSGGIDIVGGTTAVAGQWYHIAGVYNATAGTVSYYQNGRLQQTAAAPAGFNATGSFNMGKAKYSGAAADFVNGTIDEVRAYSGALTANDVEQIADSAWYKLDEGSGTTAIDAGLTQVNGTLTNGPTYGPGPINSALTFDGTNDYIDANRSNFDTSKSFSVSAWTRTTQITAARVIASADSTNYSGFSLYINGAGKWGFSRASSDVAAPTITSVLSTATATVNTWYHVAGVYDSVADTLTLYVDGVKQGEVAYTAGWRATGEFIVGRNWVAGAAANYYSGAIDEVHTYPFAIDDGMAAQLADSTPPPTPATPTATSPSATSVTLTWVAPRPISGSPTTGYVVTPYVNGVAQASQTFASTPTSRTFTGLTTGASYRYTVAAVNVNGTSPASAQSAAVVPTATVPAAPAAPTATVGTLSATVAWTAPANNGSAVTGYVVTPYIGATAGTAQTFNSTATTQTVTGLTAGTAYTFRVSAVNAVGTGAQSAASNAVTPNTNPAIDIAAPPSGQVGVAYSFTFTRTGGTSPVTWSVSAGTLPAGLSLAASTGVLSGTPTAAGTYSFTTKLSDSGGGSDTEAVSLVVTDKPATPAAPTLTVSTTTATATWVAPAANGSPITGYSIQVYRDGTLQATVATGTSTTFTSPGLTPGSVYTVTVAAINALGTSPYSDSSNPVVAYTVPAAPVITAATAADSAATLSWTAPAANGSAISSYIVTPFIGGAAQPTQSFSGSTTTASVTGLTPGTSYTFTVAAVNAAGTGPASAASAAVVPNASPTLVFAAPPPAPIGVAYSHQLTVTGGTAPFTWSVSAGTLPAGITLSAGGLLGGTPTAVGSSTFTVRVLDASAQSATKSVTLVVTDRPATPAAPTLTVSTTTATATWVEPATNGSPITGYSIRVFRDGTLQATVATGTSTTFTSPGLTAGSTYTVTVAAINAVGTSAYSDASNPVVAFSVPGAPLIGTATAGNSRATLSWTAPSGNGSAVTGYIVTPFIGGAAQPTQTFNSTATTQVVTGLTPGTSYTFTVAAVNAAGTGPASAASAAVVPNASPTLVFAAPPPAPLGVAYSHQLAVTGGTAPFTWSVSAGTLPAGITLSAGGLLSGTPTAVGSSTFTVRVLDANASSATRSVTLVVNDKPAAPAAPTATAGLTSAVLTWTAPAANGSPITGYVITPSLAGVAQSSIAVDPSAKTRTLNGLTAGGAYTFRIAAVNAVGTSALSAASNSVTPYAALNAPAITATATGDGQVTLTWTPPSSNGGSPITGYVVTPFIGVVAQTPTVFASTATTQTITGLSPGTAYTFRVAATNASGTNVLYRIDAGGAGADALDGGLPWSADNAADSPLRNSGSNSSFFGPVNGVDGTVPATTPSSIFSAERWDPAGGTDLQWFIPVGSGTPVLVRLYFANGFEGFTQPGQRTFDVALEGNTVLPAFDPIAAAGATKTGTMREFAVVSDGTININFGRLIDNPIINGIEIIQTGTATTGPPSTSSTAVTPNASPTLTFAAPPSGEVGAPYSQLLIVNDGTGPFAWSVSAGTLPAGITLNATTGRLSGTPTTAGTFGFTVQVTDANGQSATRAVSLAIEPALALAYTPVAGEVGVAYSYQPTRTGGVGPYAWAVTAGSLPAGVSLSTSTGLISGTPTAAGSYSATVSVTDGLGQVVTKTAGTVIAAAPTLTSTPPAGQSGEPYSYTFVVTGGTGPFTYSVVAGAVPSGFTLSSAGVLSGSTAVVANTSFTVQVVDSFGQTATRAVTLVIGPAPVSVVKTANVTSTTPGSVVQFTVTVTNSSTTRTFNGAQVTDPLGDLTDDAVYNNDAAPTVGTVTQNASSLQWNLTIAPSSSTTLTYSVTVANSGTGNKVLTGTITTSFLSTNCNPGTQTGACTATVNISALSIVKSADVATTTPGSTVRFTIVVTNNGRTAYTGAMLSDNLAAVLDDATYNGDATATAGNVSYASSTVSWTGNLAVGASTTITYTVTVRNPDPGNKILSGTVVSPTAGSTCPGANPAASCTASVTVLVPALVITNTANVSTTTPGSVVSYTFTLSNTGQTPYVGTSATVALAGAADDGTYNNDAAASSGTVVLNPAAGTLVWTGDLAVGIVVTITGSATVLDPDPGDKVLTTVISSPAAGSTCPVGSANPACTSNVSVLVPALTITKSSDVSTTTPGSVVTYTVLVTNTGQTPYTGATFSDNLAGVVDDALYTNNAAATTGSVSYAAPNLTWTGNLAVGASATITYTVTVNNPDLGDKSLVSTVVSTTPGNNCASGSPDGRCTSTVAVLIPGLSITTGTNVSTTTPGSIVRFTTNVTNTGQTTYTGLAITSDTTGVGDDATSNFDVTVTTGSVAAGPGGLPTWTLTLAPGQSASITGSFTVKSPATGNRSIVFVLYSNAPGSSCPAGSSNPACSSTVAVLIPGLTITKTANGATVLPAGTVDYTIVVANTGETTYPAATFTDSLTDVLNDATYAGGATATSGAVSYAAPTLSWTGALAPGATATVNFTVTVRDPAPGDKQLVNTVVSTSASANCRSGATDARCTAIVNVLVPGLTIVKTASQATTIPGATVAYTVQVTNSGATAQPSANFADWLDGVLDDTTYNDDVAATAGSASVTSNILGWSGSLAVGASATITYSVTVNAVNGGDNVLTNQVTSTTRGNNCPTGGTDARCAVSVPVARLLLVRSPAQATTTPGSVISVPASFTNTGKVAYTGISVTIPRADVFDDAFANGPDIPSSGSLTVVGDAMVWTGNIPVGGVVTIPLSRIVKDPDPGNRIIASTLVSSAPGNNCPSGGPDPRCSIAIPVLVPVLTISKVADTTAVAPGGSIGYTVTVSNTGQTAYASATVTDAMADALDHASFGFDAVASSGTVSYAAPNLTWTGSLAVGASATITYSMTANSPAAGDKDMRNTVSSSAVGSTCLPGSSNPACTSSVGVLTPALTLTKSADLSSATLGATVKYTVLVDNTGQTAYPAAAFSDSLAGVLDDATYNPGATTVTTGAVSYAGEVLSWSGPLAPGDRATITYTVTVKTPASGDQSMSNTVVSAAAGSNCASGSTDNRCTAVVSVTNARALTFTKTASAATTVPGGVVTYTVKVVNASQTAIAGVSFTDALAGVLDDATYNTDAAASTGSVTFTSPTLSWIGTVPAQGTVTITYSVTVASSGTGDEILSGTVSSTSLPSSNNCTGGSGDARCTSTVPVARLAIDTGTYPNITTPGTQLQLTTTFTNTGQVAYTGISVNTAADDLLDDVNPDGGATASSGGLILGANGITWTGDIPVGGVVSISSSVTVKNPDPGNKVIRTSWSTAAPGSNCANGSTDSACRTLITVLLPGLTITKTPSTTASVAGGVVGYTVTVQNTGETPYVGAVVSDQMAGTLDDAAYNNDAATTRGSLTYENPDLTWSGDLAVGETATISYSTTVNNPAIGDKTMVNRVSSSDAGSTCPPASGNSACRTTVVVLTPALTITKTADQANANLGTTVTYTVLVRNSGQTSYATAAFSDSLADVLDDAAYNPGASATSGTLSYADPVLSWSGALSPGASATITYSVTITNPASGDRAMGNVAVSTNVGSNCPSGSTDSRCRAMVSVTNALSLTFTKTSDVAAAAVGGQVKYTVQVVNSSDTAIIGANFTDPLAGILDDATFGNDEVASSGVVVFTAPNLTWTGLVPAGGTVTITYSVTVTSSGTGDQILTGTVSSTSPSNSNNCLNGSTDPRCTNRVTVAQLRIQQAYTESTTTPGSVIHLSATFTNTGKTNYEGITISSPSAGTVDDASPTGDQTATSGTLVLSATAITWTGSIAVGATVTVTGTLVVNDPPQGNKLITGTLVSSALGNNCPPGGSDTRCTAVSTVLIPGLTVTKTADRSTTIPGGTANYTITVSNSGEAAYAAATVTDSLAGVLDDAVYSGGAQASTGAVSYTSPTLSWTGSLAVGATATITYSVQIPLTNTGGDKTLTNAAVSNDPGSDCPTASGNAACRTTVVVLTPVLTIAASADLSTATLGSTVSYTVTVTNSGQVSYPAAAFNVDLANVLDDATYSGTATATSGTLGYGGGVLSWSGELDPGQNATITYSVAVNNPASGDLDLTSTVTSGNLGSNCRPGSANGPCRTRVTVVDAVSLTFTKTADRATTVAGGVVGYTVRVVNATGSPISGADFTDALAGTADDATYNNDAVASTGTASYTAPDLTWTGTVPAGGSVTVTYSVTVHSSPAGDLLLTGAVSSTSVSTSNNCVAGSGDPRCATRVAVAQLILRQFADEPTTTPGSVVHLTQTYVNTGQVPYVGITVSSPRADTSDDTVPTGDQVASSGTILRTATEVAWMGDIPVGGTITITRTLIVKNPDPGNQVIRATLRSEAAGNNCPSGTTDARCTFSITVLTPGLTITKTANATTVVPNGVVAYTISVVNTGQTPYAAATATDSLMGVLDDADYDANATANTGSLTFTSPELTWTGDLAVGATATITFSVTAHQRADGDKSMVNRVSSTQSGSTCLPASSNPACVNTVDVRTPELTTVVTASETTAKPGDVVGYSVTATNTGQTDYTNAIFSAPLAGLLDDATYNQNAAASSGSVVRNGQSLNWAGPLAMGATATITYSVTVNSPVTGNHRLEQTVSSTGEGSNCPSGSADPRCTTSVPIASLLIVGSSNLAVAKPTDVVQFKNTFTNTGQVPYVGISVITDVLGAGDDGTYNGDAAVTAGSIAITPGARIRWTGDLAVGETVTLTASLTVKNPDPGNKLLSGTLISDTPGSNCPTGSTDPACRINVPVLTPVLAISKAADRSTTTPGGTVNYTITVQNTGETVYTAAEVTDFLGGFAGTSDDGDYTGTPSATSGTVVFADPGLRWTGDVGVGETVLISYSVLVDNPDLGDRTIYNTVSSDALGSTCPTNSTNRSCSAMVTVLVPALDIALTADTTSTTPGSTVSYSLTVTNSGQTPYLGASVTASLAGVLDDASYSGGATSTLGGSLAYGEGALTWTGDLPVGATTTINYTVQVFQPALGNRQLTTSVTSPAAGSTCTTDTDCVNTVTVLIPGLAVSTSADVATATPDDRVVYTITLANTGQTAYVGLTATSVLTGVLDDSTLNGSIQSSIGVASYSAPTLTWTGNLPVGATAVITYSVTVRSPDPANKRLTNTVVVNAAGSSCPTGGTNPSCTNIVIVLVPALTIAKSADVATTTPGGTVTYTINLTNSGETAYSGAKVVDNLSNVLSDSTYNADAVVTGGGALAYEASNLTWTGDLLIEASATITYSVTVKDPDLGDKYLVNSVSSTASGSTCPPGNAVAACTTAVTVLIPSLSVTKSVDRTVVTAGGAVAYTVTVTNDGQTDFAPATFTDVLSGVLDDADYAGDAATDVGTVDYADETVAWTGALAIGETATVTYSVTTRFPALGDRILNNRVVSASAGSTCRTGAEGSCSTTVTVLVPALTISKTADRPEVVGRGTVAYTITATNTGEADYPDAALMDSLAGVLDDAAYNGDAVASRGTPTYAGEVLSWNGSLAQGEDVTISYSVTVATVPAGDSVLTNQVVSASVGSTCPDGGADAACSTSTEVSAGFIGLTGLTPSFTLTGLPGSTVASDNAVVMTVDTNSLGGYNVTVRGSGGAELQPTTFGNTDRIPLGQLRVRENGIPVFTPLSDVNPFVVHRQDGPSSAGGDPIANDYQVSIPFVASDTYTTTLEYIATAE